MLVLSRRRKESIYLGDDVVVTVVDIGRNRVRLAIEAPPEVVVRRAELHLAVQTAAAEKQRTYC